MNNYFIKEDIYILESIEKSDKDLIKGKSDFCFFNNSSKKKQKKNKDIKKIKEEYSDDEILNACRNYYNFKIEHNIEINNKLWKVLYLKPTNEFIIETYNSCAGIEYWNKEYKNNTELDSYLLEQYNSLK